MPAEPFEFSTAIPSGIVLMLDGIGANMLGAYGNTLYETQAFNQLAADSLVFDQLIASSTNLDSAYQDLWSFKQENNDGDHLIETLAAKGVRSVLLTDDLEIQSHELASSFEKIVNVPSAQSSKLADSIEETELASFFAQAAEQIANLERGILLWIHCSALTGSWDAPYSLRCQLADSEDPDPPKFHESPVRTLLSDDDPDERLAYQQACAAQVMMIDRFLGVILEMVQTSTLSDSTIFCVSSTRGFPLGEHLAVGWGSSCLNNEAVHVPMMIRLPDRPEFTFAKCARLSHLLQPVCLSGILFDWFQSVSQVRERLSNMLNQFPDAQRQWVVSNASESQAIQSQSIQTAAWKLIRSQNGEVQLYAKPDDLWESNNVSRRCPAIVEQLSGWLDQCVEKAILPDSVLPEELGQRFE